MGFIGTHMELRATGCCHGLRCHDGRIYGQSQFITHDDCIQTMHFMGIYIQFMGFIYRITPNTDARKWQ